MPYDFKDLLGLVNVWTVAHKGDGPENFIRNSYRTLDAGMSAAEFIAAAAENNGYSGFVRVEKLVAVAANGHDIMAHKVAEFDFGEEE